jgi:hypothetical protein
MRRWRALVFALFSDSWPKVLFSFSSTLLMITRMPNLYFCQPHAKNQGMLRAVLSVHECERVLSQHPATYVGEQFPTVAGGLDATNDFAVISFRPEETTPAWRSGYYRLDSDLMQLNDAILQLSR